MQNQARKYAPSMWPIPLVVFVLKTQAILNCGFEPVLVASNLKMAGPAAMAATVVLVTLLT
jgi:hypothetical protein